MNSLIQVSPNSGGDYVLPTAAAIFALWLFGLFVWLSFLKDQIAEIKQFLQACVDARKEERARRAGIPPNQFVVTAGRQVYCFYSERRKGYRLDEIHQTEIASDIGPRAKIAWKYSAEKLEKLGFTKHEFDPKDNWYPGDTPAGIDETLGRVAKVSIKDISRFSVGVIAAARRNPLKWRQLMHEMDEHYDFDQFDILKTAARLPIQIVSIDYEDRRPQPEAEVAPDVASRNTLRIGMTVPPPLPEVKPGTPFYDLPKPVPARPFGIPLEARDKTVYILGIPGMGKSTLLAAMIREDIQKGRGVGVIDPAGDLAEAVLSYVPRSRIKDCVYLDPTRSPIGINFFNAKDEAERDLIAEDIVTIFKRLTATSETYEQTNAVLARSVQLLAQHRGAKFFDIHRLLTDLPFQKRLAADTKDEGLRAFWLREYPTYPHPGTERPITTRLQKFDTSSAVRTITGTTSSLDFYEAIRQNKIIIVNLATTRIGEGPANLLGTLFVSQFQLAAFRQGNLPLSERVPFYLYVDEFQNFATSAFNTIITQARKFKLCLTLANQKLVDLDDKTRTAVLAANTRICFRPEDEDARKLGTSMGGYDAHALMNQNEYYCVIRPGKPSDTVQVKIDIPPRYEFNFAEEILAHTQRTYGSEEPTRQLTSAVRDEEPGPSGPRE